MSISTIIVCIFAGVGAGLGTGLAGMSAAVVIGPMLIAFLDVGAYEAIGIALASDVLASAVSAVTYARNKNIDIKDSLVMFGAIIIFTFIGAYLAFLVPDTTLGNFTVFAALWMGINFLIKSFKKEKTHLPRQFSKSGMLAVQLACGVGVGFVCGFVGAGGGIMMLILLTMVLGYEVKTAVGTSVFIMTFTALFGAGSHFVLQGSFPDPTIFCLCVVFTLIFARVGAKYANKAETRKLNRAIGVVLTILGLSLVLVTYLPYFAV